MAPIPIAGPFTNANNGFVNFITDSTAVLRNRKAVIRSQNFQ